MASSNFDDDNHFDDLSNFDEDMMNMNLPEREEENEEGAAATVDQDQGQDADNGEGNEGGNGQGNNGGDDEDDASFSEVAYAAAKAMESLDMEQILYFPPDWMTNPDVVSTVVAGAAQGDGGEGAGQASEVSVEGSAASKGSSAVNNDVKSKGPTAVAAQSFAAGVAAAAAYHYPHQVPGVQAPIPSVAAAPYMPPPLNARPMNSTHYAYHNQVNQGAQNNFNGLQAQQAQMQAAAAAQAQLHASAQAQMQANAAQAAGKLNAHATNAQIQAQMQANHARAQAANAQAAQMNAQINANAARNQFIQYPHGIFPNNQNALKMPNGKLPVMGSPNSNATDSNCKASVPSTIAVPQKENAKPSSAATAASSAPAPVSNAPYLSSVSARSTSILNAASVAAAELPTCVRCSYPGADVRIAGCSRKCAFHARCINLVGLAGLCQQVQQGGKGTTFVMSQCPHCKGSANGLEMIPLVFAEMDRAHGQSRFEKGLVAGLASSLVSSDVSSGNAANVAAALAGNKRTIDCVTPITASSLSSNSQYGSTPCYDPSTPRTGRWAPDEISFRDSLIVHFLHGNFPLSKGLKLNDFLPNMLKSKQSRLAKKMKHAKLSTKYFHPKMGFIENDSDARELSRLEANFVNGIVDPVERSEIRFHMQREWRDHFAERCALLSVPFEATKWIQSVDVMEKRLAAEKNKNRMAKRRYLMGKAMEKDVSGGVMPGVFIENNKKEVDLDTALDATAIVGNNVSVANHGNKSHSQDGGTAASAIAENNFRQASPFLACVSSYLERNAIPFEHVDAWIPSFSPQTEEDGSGGSSPQGDFRLCFGGSATISSVLVQDSESQGSNQQANVGNPPQSPKRIALTPEESLRMSLFGDYSKKFSFASGCGLPGRVFKSGTPAWEQFVNDACSSHFERRGGAMQFGIKTALALPIFSPNVGRIVLVMYSKYDRVKDEMLIDKIVKDMKKLNPSPKWKLVVEVSPDDDVFGEPTGSANQALGLKRPADSTSSAPKISTSCNAAGTIHCNQHQPPSCHDSVHSGTSVATDRTTDEKIKDLVLLLGENIPSDQNSPLGQQLHSIMSLRLVLLKSQRSSDEQQLVDTIIVLFESYVNAGRSRADIAVMITRDFSFHTMCHQQASIQQKFQQQQHSQQQQQIAHNQNHYHFQASMPPPTVHVPSQHAQAHPTALFQSNHKPSMSPMTSPEIQGQQQMLYRSNNIHNNNIVATQRRHSNYVSASPSASYISRANSSGSEHLVSPRSTITR